MILWENRCTLFRIMRQGACMKNSRQLLLAFLLLFPTFAPAQNFPAKPIKLIVPLPAGGPNDIIARVIGPRMSQPSAPPVPIDNRARPGAVPGTAAVAKRAPDDASRATS